MEAGAAVEKAMPNVGEEGGTEGTPASKKRGRKEGRREGRKEETTYPACDCETKVGHCHHTTTQVHLHQ